MAANTSDFIDRRIDNVMQIEKAKASFKKTPLAKPFMSLQDVIFSKVKAPDLSPRTDLPGRWNRPVN
jgi:ubiquinone biosynthesis protein COQ9